MAYIFQGDPRVSEDPAFFGDQTQEGGGMVANPYAAPMENLWDRYLPALGFTGPLKEVVGYSDPTQEGGAQPIEGRSRAAQAFIDNLKSQGFQIGLKESALGKQKHQYALVGPDGQPVAGSDVTIDAGNAQSLVRALAPMAIGALTAGLGAQLGAAMGATAGSTAASALGGATIAGGVTALGGGSLKDVATNALLAGAIPYATEALGLTGGMSSELTPEMQATISSNPQGAFLGEGVPSGIPSWDAAAMTAGVPLNFGSNVSLGDMMTGVDMSGNIVNSLTGEVLVPATSAPINALAGAGIAEGMAPGVTAPATAAELAGTGAVLAGGAGAAGAGAAGAGAAGAGAAGAGAAGAGAAGAGAGAAAAGAAGSAAAGAAGAAAAGSIWGPLIGSLASLYGGQQTSQATERAAELYTQQADRALQLQEQMYREGVERQTPFYQAGVNALTQMAGQTNAMPEAFQYTGQQPTFNYAGQAPTYSYTGQQPTYAYEGAPPEAFSFTAEQMQADPGYAFRLSEGLKALERSAAARGGLMSGATGKALTRFGQEMGSQEFGAAYNRALTGYESQRQREAELYGRGLTSYEIARQREAEQYGRGLTSYEIARAQEADQYNRAMAGYDVNRLRESEQYNRALTGYNALRQREAEGYNRLAGISGVGGTMSQDLTRAGQQYATNAGNLMGSQGQVGANALLSGAAARQSAYGDVGQIWGKYFGG